MTEPLDDARGETSPIGQADIEMLNHLADSMGFGRTHDMLRRVIAAAPYLRPSPVTQCEAEPVAWRIIPEDTMFLYGTTVTDDKEVAEGWRKGGNRVETLYATPPSRLDAESARAAAVEECARRVESTGLRNPDNIARDIRALSPDPGTVAVASGQSSTHHSSPQEK